MRDDPRGEEEELERFPVFSFFLRFDGGGWRSKRRGEREQWFDGVGERNHFDRGILFLLRVQLAESNELSRRAYQAVNGESRSRKGESLVLYAESVEAISRAFYLGKRKDVVEGEMSSELKFSFEKKTALHLRHEGEGAENS